MQLFALTVIARGAAAAPIAMASGGFSLHLDTASGEFDLFVDGAKWLARDDAAASSSGMIPLVGGRMLGPPTLHHKRSNGTDKWGAFSSIELAWADSAAPPHSPTLLITSIRAYEQRELLAFTQTWPRGLTQTGAPGSDATTIAAYPTLTTSSAGNTTVPLNYYQWGGCQIANSFGGRFTDATNIPGGQRLGMPLLLYNRSGRSLVVSPAQNWLTAVHEEGNGTVGIGIKASVKILPPGFTHETVLVGGPSINRTMYNLGDALLALSGKKRAAAYDDFVLSHLGYWTDNGAFYGSANNDSGYINQEVMLRAMKKQWEAQSIPFRYVQWDDWQWVNGSHHPDIPGPYPNWLPLPSVIPSGMTDWLGMPTSLYNPMYSANTSYISANPELGAWAVDTSSAMGGSAIPLDPAYYRAAFRNGSRAKMKMFEQDFLCTYQWTTNLTTSDVTTGMMWMHAMDDAAASFTDYEGNNATTTLQLCMMTPPYALASTELMRVTNARGTSDNLHNSRADLYKLGPSGLLLGAMGLWNSRDNVFTSPKEQGCADRQKPCTSPDYRLENVAAVLGGGPYGPSDGLHFLNARLIHRSCRSDGVLLKTDRPLAMTDAALLVNFDATFRSSSSSSSSGGGGGGDEAAWVGHVWATATNVGSLRWSYVLSIDTTSDLLMTLASLEATPGCDYLLWEFWATNGTGAPRHATPISAKGGDFVVPKSPPASALLPPSSAGRYQILVPVLANGWSFLGEIEKIVPVSAHRFRSITEVAAGLRATVHAASGERVAVWVLTPSATKAAFHSGAAGASEGGAAAVPIAPMEVVCAAPTCKGEDCETKMSLFCDFTVLETCTCGVASIY